MDQRQCADLAEALVPLVARAGQAILDARAGGVAVSIKSDGTPVTEADRRADEIVVEGLARLAGSIPVVSEERSAVGSACSQQAAAVFFLVDPLDGTRDFIAGSDDFTVNIALVEDGRPVCGAMLAPALSRCFISHSASGRAVEINPVSAERRRLEPRRPPLGGLTVAVSRRHDAAVSAFAEKLPPHRLLPRGSALKFALVAAGEAHIYPRLAPTCAWDTAAGQAVLEAAGGVVLDFSGRPLRYDNSLKSFVNPSFLAAASESLARDALRHHV